MIDIQKIEVVSAPIKLGDAIPILAALEKADGPDYLIHYFKSIITFFDRQESLVAAASWLKDDKIDPTPPDRSDYTIPPSGEPKMEAVYVGTTNDRNGNPRRGWIIYSATTLGDFVDEGYEGRDALRSAYPRHYESDPYFGNKGPQLFITPDGYAWLKRLGQSREAEAFRRGINRKDTND